MKKLLQDIKGNSFKNIYLLFGEERYLVQLYEKKLKEVIMDSDMEMMNMDIFQEKCDVEDIINAASTLPFMQEYRLVIVRDSGLFTTGRKDDTDKMVKALLDISPSTVVVFNESQVDKRNKLYKKTADIGRAVDFVTPTDKELVSWIIRNFKDSKKNISPKTAMLLIKTVGRDMNVIVGECEKLVAYKGSSEIEIEEIDIESVCIKTLETKIFDMIGALCNKKTDTALDIFANMLQIKESPIMVISMLARQFRLILQSKFMAEQGNSPYDISVTLAQRSYVVDECLRQSRNFTKMELIEALKDCLEADTNIKTGRMKDRLAVEMIIIKYGSK